MEEREVSAHLAVSYSYIDITIYKQRDPLYSIQFHVVII